MKWRNRVLTLVLSVMLLPAAVLADEVTKMIQMDLIALGYDPGNIQGEATTETIVAISTFQAENNLDVDGKPTPQLAGIIKAKLKAKNSGGATVAAEPAAPSQADVQAARDACLQKKVVAAQQKPKKKNGFGSLMNAVSNTASRYGGDDLVREVSQTSAEIYDANATAADWEQAAKDMGLTTSDIEECQNPSG